MSLKLGIIGHFGGNKSFFDGQTVKTKNVAMLLESQLGISVLKVDTYYFKTNVIKLLIDTFSCLLRCDYIIFLASVKGMSVLLPMFYYLNKFTRKHIFHYIIGSELLEMVTKNEILIKYLNALDGNWFEYESGTQYLRKKGVTNVITLPNFKSITPVSEVYKYIPKNGVYQFCTFSRVMREKGITDAINSIVNINDKYGYEIAHLDIYGPIHLNYEREFENLLKLHSNFVTYKGIVDSTQSVDVLKRYYALLFPTYWPGEGMPGTIIDTFAAGIPVIASDWNANKEIIQNMKQGIIYPNEEVYTLEDAIMWSLRNKAEMLQMREESRKEFIKYMPATILARICDEFQKM